MGKLLNKGKKRASRTIGENLKGIQSVELGGRVLAALATAGRPVPLGAVAKAADMSPSKARRYLISFSRIGFVEQDPETLQYDLSWFALQLGLAALARRDVVRLGRPVVRELGFELGLTSALVIWSRGQPVVVQREDSDRSVLQVIAQVGAPVPLLGAASGQIFAAYLPRERVADLIKKDFREMTPRLRRMLGLETMEDLERTLRQVRRKGLARMVGSVIEGLNIVASAAFDGHGEVQAAIVVLGTKQDVDVRWNGPVAQALQRASAELSRHLGYSGPLPPPRQEQDN